MISMIKLISRYGRRVTRWRYWQTVGLAIEKKLRSTPLGRYCAITLGKLFTSVSLFHQTL